MNSSATSIAVIGGGISGLVCAQRLVELGLVPTVFDTGK
jgi:predicted NAD/FAD-dependent oxidoreductase